MRLAHLCRAVIAATVTTAGLSACDRTDQGEVRVEVVGETPKLVDPATGTLTAPQAVLLSNVAQGLVRFDARGQIVPGLAERWTVTDDGLSYIFRIESGEWPGGGKITAHQIARLLRRQLARRSDNSLKDTLGAIAEVVPMTDRVLEIRLSTPRPSLLQLLAQPELAMMRDGRGTGPFQVQPDSKPPAIRLERTVVSPDEEESRLEQVVLAAAAAKEAVGLFAKGSSDLVIGGTFADLPYAQAADLPRNALRFDPAAGLFGLVPGRSTGPIADVEFRRLLAQAIDRQALIDALNVPGLLPRATLLEPGLDGLPDPAAPAWSAVPMAERQPALVAAANQRFGDEDRPVLTIAVPEGPGAQILLNRLSADWAPLGIRVERAKAAAGADLVLIDAVAPSTSPAWFLRQFRCGEAPVCDVEVDTLLDRARDAIPPAEHNGWLAQAAARADEQQLFIAFTAPIRWSLVSDRVTGFAPNRFARHTLTGLTQRLNRERSE